MALDIILEFEDSNLRKTLTNSREVLNEIKKRFPTASITRVAKIADVSESTVNRWRRHNRADWDYFEPVWDYYEAKTEDTLEAVLLREATVPQLRERIDEIGWKRVCSPTYNVSKKPKRENLHQKTVDLAQRKLMKFDGHCPHCDSGSNYVENEGTYWMGEGLLNIRIMCECGLEFNATSRIISIETDMIYKDGEWEMGV
jgi:transposase-like protein